MADLMQCEKDVIINSMLRKSSVQIADMLGLDKTIVAEFVREHAGAVITMDRKIELRHTNRPVKKVEPKKEKIKKQQRKKERVITSARSVHSVKKRQEKKYANRQLQFEKLVGIKIDHRTFIYVKPGTDMEKAKRNFLNISKYKPI